MGHQVGPVQQESKEVSLTSIHYLHIYSHTHTHTRTYVSVYTHTYKLTYVHSRYNNGVWGWSVLATCRWGQDYQARKDKLQAENQELQVLTKG